MRATLLILATLGALAVCVAVAVGLGLFRLSSMAPVREVRLISPTTQSANDEDPGDAPTVATTDVDADAADQPDSVLADPARSIILHAEDAKISGPRITVGSVIANKKGKANKNKDAGPTIWKWREPSDLAEWTFAVPKAGKYSIALNYSAGGDEDQIGGTFELTVGGHQIKGTVPQTNRSRAFRIMDIGPVQLAAGQARLTIRPTASLEGSLMNLRDVRLLQTD